MIISVIHLVLNREGAACVHTQRSCGELSLRLPVQGSAAAGPDVSARLHGGSLRRIGGRRVHGCGGHGGRSVAGEARLRLRLSGRACRGDRGDAVVRGILCNFLVCIAVWMASAAKSVPGKILAVFFPIMTFVVAGFEHSVANMYYLTAGLLTAAQTGAAAEGLTWGRALACNLLPVTLGNLVGGVLLVGVSAWYLYLKQGKTAVNS